MKIIILLSMTLLIVSCTMSTQESKDKLTANKDYTLRERISITDSLLNNQNNLNGGVQSAVNTVEILKNQKKMMETIILLNKYVE